MHVWSDLLIGGVTQKYIYEKKNHNLASVLLFQILNADMDKMWQFLAVQAWKTINLQNQSLLKT